MDKYRHFLSYVIGVIVCYLIYYCLKRTFNPNQIYAVILTGWLMNPDWIEPSKDSHRWFIGHSVIYPMAWYFVFRIYYVYTPGMDTNDISLVLFLPIICHLICDLGGVQGFGLINFYPIHIFKRGKYSVLKLDVKWSYIWIIANIILMTVLMILWNSGY